MSSYPIIHLSEAALINLIEPSIDIDQLLVKSEGVGDITNAPSAPPSSALAAPLRQLPLLKMR